MNSTLGISLIIVTYNAAATLQKCLDSIYKQAFHDIKIIIIDGNSTDETVAIIEANKTNIFYWKSESDSGIYDAMNKALLQISSIWVYFLGADDELLPDFSNMVMELKDTSAIYYANVWADGEKRSGELTYYKLAKFGIYHQAMIYPTAVFSKYNYDTKYKISADFALTLNICGDYKFHFIYKDYLIANFNHQGVSGVEIDKRFQKDKAGLVFKNFGIKIWVRYKWHRFKNRNNPRA
ncbi:MAG: glycosyltransferase [Janthinobacterium lividum]